MRNSDERGLEYRQKYNADFTQGNARITILERTHDMCAKSVSFPKNDK
ncbi:Uncharacterised protein [uncultured archaeon]|nr:Uncharacterised protein [uncultured archaeon]